MLKGVTTGGDGGGGGGGWMGFVIPAGAIVDQHAEGYDHR